MHPLAVHMTVLTCRRLPGSGEGVPHWFQRVRRRVKLTCAQRDDDIDFYTTLNDGLAKRPTNDGTQ